MQGFDEIDVQLQQRFAAGEDDKRLAALGPGVLNGGYQGIRRRKPSAAGTVRAHEIRIAKWTDGRSPVFFPAGPQVAAREPAEHGRPPRVRPFALKRVINFLDRKHHSSRWISGIENVSTGLSV